MYKILFINTVCGFSSTGKITGDLAKQDLFESLVCYGRKKDYIGINSYRFSNLFDNCIAAFETIFFDNNLNVCRLATKRLIKKIREFNPDIIHLHNLHGYYLNVEMLFNFLKGFNKPIVWTLHDCWSMTGYCPHFDMINCDKYRIQCTNCEHRFSYPFSIFKQNVECDYNRKKELFNNIDNLTIVTPSKWLESIVQNSYLKNNKTVVINNGINIKDIEHKKTDKFKVIAVASYWTKEKGIDELEKIIPLLDNDIEVTIVGDLKKKSKVFNRCRLIPRTNDTNELYELYAESDVLVNTTLEEVLSLVNIESQMCGTPVVTYNTGGAPETITDETGIVIEKYDYEEAAKVINYLKNNYRFDDAKIKNNAKKYSKEIMLNKYDELYKRIIDESYK